MVIALVEDNEGIRESLAAYFSLEGFELRQWSTLPTAQELLASGPVLAILDVMVPGGSGFALAKELRALSQLPIIFLTAMASESDRITGLELGADDFVTKPFSPRELVLRVKALLRRVGTAPETAPQPEPGAQPGAFGASGAALCFSLDGHGLEIDPGTLGVRADSVAQELTAAEWHILLYLVEKRPQVLSRGLILERCLDSIAMGSERTVDTHVKNLRHKIGSPWIETLRGFGYRFAPEAKICD